MRIKLLFSLGILFATVNADAQLNLFGQQKQRIIHPSTPTMRGGGNTGETCGDAIIAVLGANVADGPSSGNGCMNCTEDAVNADWFVYQATGAGLVTISSCLQGVDTRLWVYESDANNCNNLNPIAGNDDFCEITSGGEEFASQVDFYVCSGKYYYIEWDDNWENTGFSFMLSFVGTSGADITTSGNISEYTMMPKSAAILHANASYRNTGDVALNNIQSELIITKNGSPFYNNTASVAASLATCSADMAALTEALTQETGTYNAQVRIFANESETNTANNIISQSYIVDTTYARDNGSSFIAAAVGQEAILGHNFYLPKPDKLTSVSIKLADVITPGTQANVSIYATDVNGKPTTELGATIPHNLVDSDTTGWLTLGIGDGGLDLPAGTFFVGSRETVSSVDIPLGVSLGIYTPGVAWVNVPGQTPGFMAIEDIGLAGATFMIRPNFGQTYSWASIDESTNTVDITVMPNPSAGIFTISSAESIQRISVIDATGKLIKDETVNNITGNHSMDLTSFANGIYNVRITSGKQVVNKRVIVSH